MIGWEFPPFISGGLGTACYGLTKAMDKMGMHLIFVLPKNTPIHFGSSKLKTEKLQSCYDFKNIDFFTISSTLIPYKQPEKSAYNRNIIKFSSTQKIYSYKEKLSQHFCSTDNYAKDMFSEIHRFTQKTVEIARNEDFDIIHAHDWMTYPAALAVAAESGMPLVVQIHSTEFDRSGEHVNQLVYDIERKGMHLADKVIAVSNYTRNIIINRYLVPAEKVEVVHNGIEFNQSVDLPVQDLPAKTDKIVLFLGRITMQKGPEYFLYAAKKVLENNSNVKFIMAGDGDMLYRSIELAASLGIGHKVLFTRFLRGIDVDKTYRMADLYVMPSVSEPFGIAPLEALRNNVPVLISKQSGISEVLNNALKVDFWDINKMADKIIAVLKHPPLHKTLRENGYKEVYKFRWEDSAARISDIYENTLNQLESKTK